MYKLNASLYLARLELYPVRFWEMNNNHECCFLILDVVDHAKDRHVVSISSIK